MQGYSYDQSRINARLQDLSERDRAAVVAFDRLYWNKLYETTRKVFGRRFDSAQVHHMHTVWHAWFKK